MSDDVFHEKDLESKVCNVIASTIVRKRRKRGRGMFSSSKYKYNQAKQRQLLKKEMQNVHASETSEIEEAKNGQKVSRMQAEDDVQGTKYATNMGKKERELFPWDWKTCDEYFNLLDMKNVEDLTAIRTENANMVAANMDILCYALRNDSPLSYLRLSQRYFDILLKDATDTSTDKYQRLRRGRFYRDHWAEEGYIVKETIKEKEKSGKKSSFAFASVLSTYSDLVYGYDDDLFQTYLHSLELAHAQGKQNACLQIPSRSIYPASSGTCSVGVSFLFKY